MCFESSGFAFLHKNSGYLEYFRELEMRLIHKKLCSKFCPVLNWLVICNLIDIKYPYFN